MRNFLLTSLGLLIIPLLGIAQTPKNSVADQLKVDVLKPYRNNFILISGRALFNDTISMGSDTLHAYTSGSNFYIERGDVGGNTFSGLFLQKSGGNHASAWLGTNSSNIQISDDPANTDVEVEGNVNIADTLFLNHLVIGGDTMSSITMDNSHTDALFNVTTGTDAGASLTTGYSNVFNGYQSGVSNTTANENTYFGYKSGYANIVGIDNTGIGSSALLNNVGSYNTAIGRETMKDNTTGEHNGAFGGHALFHNKTGSFNTACGVNALYTADASFNTAVGEDAMRLTTTGTNNVSVGYQSMYKNTTQSYNTVIGEEALWSAITGIGQNVVVGASAMYNATGIENTCVGTTALKNLTAGDYNIALGWRAGYGITSGNSNIYIGRESGNATNTGSGNIFIGDQSGYNETGSNKLYIENSNSATPLIYGDFSTDKLTTNGDHYVTDSLFTNTISPYSGTTTTVTDNFTAGNATTDTSRFIGYVGINNTNPSTWLNIRTGQTTTHGISVDGYSATITDYPEIALKRSHSNTLGTLSATQSVEFLGFINAYSTTSTNSFGRSAGIIFKQHGASGTSGGLANIYISTIGATNSTTLYDRIFINTTGRIGIGGAATISAPTTLNYTLSFNGTIAQSIGVEANAATAAGSNLSINAGGNTAGGTADLNGGMMTVSPGISKGTGSASVRLQRNSRAATTATTLNTLYDAVVIPSEFNLTDAGNNDLFEISLADAGTVAAGATVQFSIIASDGTDIQTYTGTVLISASNKAGTLTQTITEATANSALSAGTLTTVWSIVDGANKITIRLVPTSSLTPTSFKCYYTVFNNSTQSITQL